MPSASLLAIDDDAGLVEWKDAVTCIDPCDGSKVMVKREDVGALVLVDNAADASNVVAHRVGDVIDIKSVGPCQLESVGARLQLGEQDLLQYLLQERAYADVFEHTKFVEVRGRVSARAFDSITTLAARGTIAVRSGDVVRSFMNEFHIAQQCCVHCRC